MVGGEDVRDAGLQLENAAGTGLTQAFGLGGDPDYAGLESFQRFPERSGVNQGSKNQPRNALHDFSFWYNILLGGPQAGGLQSQIFVGAYLYHAQPSNPSDAVWNESLLNQPMIARRLTSGEVNLIAQSTTLTGESAACSCAASRASLLHSANTDSIWKGAAWQSTTSQRSV